MNLYFLDGQNQLQDTRSLVEHTVKKTDKTLSAFFDTNALEISIVPFVQADAPKWGIGGVALNSQRVEIYLDANHCDLQGVIENDLPAVLAHEVHHTQRIKTGLPSQSLIQYLILEGLACHFERNVNGGETPSLFADIKGINWHDLYKDMEPLLNSRAYSFEDLFLNDKEQGLPKYAGYWVGYNLVKEYLDNTNISEAEALHLEAEAFLSVA